MTKIIQGGQKVPLIYSVDTSFTTVTALYHPSHTLVVKMRLILSSGVVKFK